MEEQQFRGLECPMRFVDTPHGRAGQERTAAGQVESDATCGLADWGLEIWHHG